MEIKLHVLVTTEGFFTIFVVTISNIDDRNSLFELSSSLGNTSIVEDQGCIVNDLAISIARKRLNVLFGLKCKNIKIP